MFTHGKDKPYSVAGFGNWFRDAIRAAGLSKELGIHGLRKYGAVRLAENGANEPEIMSFLGHKTPHEARTYWAAANRDKLTENGLRRVAENEDLPNLEGGLGKTINQLIVMKGKK